MTARLAPFALALVLAACGATPPEASGERLAPEAPSIESLVDSLDAELDLTGDQREPIRRALETRRADLRLARSLPSRAERQAARDRARTEADARIYAALAREQQARYAEIQAERPTDRDPRVAREAARLRQRLDLTDAQAESITALLEDELDQIEALVAQYRRQGGREIPEVREEIQEIQRATDDRIAGELTEEQAAEFAALRAEDRRPRRQRRR